MRIVVFDDSDEDRRSVVTLIQSWASMRIRPDIIIREFDNIDSLSFALPELLEYDAFFLDIMTSCSQDEGYHLAETLRTNGILAPIIFITNSKAHLIEAFEISTFRYLIKPVQKNKLYEALDHLSSSPSIYRLHSIVFHGLEDDLLIENDKIAYIEAHTIKHQASVHLVSSEDVDIRLLGSFSDLTETILSKEFVQCHRGYIINLNYVRRYNATDVYIWTMGQEILIPLGKKYRDSFLNQLIDYHKEL